MAEERSGGGQGKQVVASIVTLITLVVIFTVVFPQFADYGEAWDAVKGMPGWAVIGLVLATVGLILVYPLRYQASLPGMGYRSAFSVSQTAFAIGNGIPAGGAIALGVQYRMLGDYGFGSGPASAAIGINSVWNTLVIVAMAVVSVVGVVVAGEVDAWVVLTAVAVAVVLAVIVRLLYRLFDDEDVARRLGGLADRVVHWVAGRRGRDADRDLTAKLLWFRSSTRHVIVENSTAINVTTVVSQLMSFVVLFVALRGVEADAATQTRLIEVFAAYSVGRLGGFIPLTPGGLGTVDALITALLVSLGAVESEALAATLVWRVCTFVPQMIVGIIVYLRWRRWRTTDEAP